MTDLNRLAVSLTKHGAHKLATLLRIHDKDDVLDHLWGSVEGVNIELAQAKKNLSVGADGAVPDVWNKARALGDPAIDGLVLIAIIASHHSIIEALIKGREGTRGRGIVQRDDVLLSKSFTNVAHIIEQLGYSTEHEKTYVRYDFSRLFTIPGLNELAAELLSLKLSEAKWDKRNSLVDELVALRLHEAFAVSEDFFRDWITTGGSGSESRTEQIEDAEFFEEADDEVPSVPFAFAPGHTPKKTGVVAVVPKSAMGRARLLHNEMQTELYKQLSKEHGKECVGTEVPAGNGGSLIDVVVKTRKFCWFYEIKTAKSVKACIRQAIPQLLEYAYWDGEKNKCDRLIIVGPSPITRSGQAYLSFLRATFGLELHYIDCQVPQK